MGSPGDADPAKAADNADTLQDRRRPGRPGHVSPELVPLLRNPATVEIPEDVQADRAGVDLDEDGLRAARGIAVAVLLALPLWAFVALAIWWVVR